ncbi:MAG TPA: VOC family protein [Acidimicrobiales bacterium]|nr:VOC family protein [Acidimicrobiales bacterium]
MQPILHLSIPVRDIDEAREFYVHTLGCQAARARSGFTDVWFFGLQITLQDRPDEVAPLKAGGSRHFGVTLSRDDFDAMTARLTACGVAWVVPVSTDDEGRSTEQTKVKIADPSGNVIEFKTYRDVDAALEISSHSYPEAFAHGN